MDPFIASENASTLSHLMHLWPEFLIAWLGWMVHSLVHSAGHVIKMLIGRGWRLLFGYLTSR